MDRRKMEIDNVFHPSHKLTYMKSVKRNVKSAVCAACSDEILSEHYSCRECTFFLDFKCALPKVNRIHNFEELHHHPLIFQPRPAKFRCDLCSSTGGEGDKEDQSYSCSICDLYIHQSCALAAIAQLGHPHELSLVIGVPKDLQIYDGLSCDVCHSIVSPKDEVCHCPRCRYFVHLGCMMTKNTYSSIKDTVRDAVDYLDESFFQYLLKNGEFDIVDSPPSDVSSELIQPFLLGKKGIVMDVQPKIRHSSHKQHDMILFEEQAVNNDYFFEEEDEEILCDACIHPITAPYYRCQECNYFLHLACANLPSQIKHFTHSHELKLFTCTRFYKLFRCSRCQQNCNGLRYWCETCDFTLDLTCAALPAVIMHTTHEHPLYQMTAEDEAPCYGCGKNEVNGKILFKCRFCDVYLHYLCAMRSEHIRHRWDRPHPLALRFPPHQDHPDHFMCDMCEELIHPVRWLYSCFQCEVSFHTFCAPRYEQCPNIKYGGKVQISSHQHILQYLRKATVKITCDTCEGNLDSNNVFECETCYDCFCSSCVTSELLG